MDKAELITRLQNFTANQSLSADLYFVLKNEDNNYELFSTTPSQELVGEMISSYIELLEKYANPMAPFELHSIFNDNERNWNYLYFDTLDRTPISTSILSSDTRNARPYSQDFGDYASIFGFVVDIYHQPSDTTVRIFKKAVPTQAMRRSRVFALSRDNDGRFKSLERDAVYFQKDIDVFRIGNRVVIKSYNVYENNFKFDEVLKSKVQESLRILLQIRGFRFTDSAIRHISNLNNTKRKKLINCVIDNKILTEEKYKHIKTQAKRYLENEFKISADDKIVINSKNDVDALIKILNREINRNSATNEVFHTPTKKLLKVYSPASSGSVRVQPDQA